MTLTALVVDDHQLLAHSLAIALRQEGLVCSVAALDDPAALIARVELDPPDLVLLDLDLGGAIGSGARLVAPLVASGSRVLVVSASEDCEQIAEVLRLGAVGVVSKTLAFDRVLAVALAAATGGTVMDQADRDRALALGRSAADSRARSLAPFEALTPREALVLEALVDGLNVTVIAARWFLSEATIRSQVRGVLTKLGVTSQLEAVAAAHRAGWVAPGGCS